jgi:hypothetical protein
MWVSKIVIGGLLFFEGIMVLQTLESRCFATPNYFAKRE